MKRYFNLEDVFDGISEMPEQEQNVLTKTEILLRLAEHDLIDEEIHGRQYNWLNRAHVYEHQCLET